MDENPDVVHIEQRPNGTWFRIMAPFEGAPMELWWQEESTDGLRYERPAERRT